MTDTAARVRPLVATSAVTIIGSDDEAISAARTLATEFAVDAAERDLNRILPAAEVDVMSAAGLFAITVPREYGGADVRASTLAEVFRLLATADPNIAQIPHSHFVYVNLLRLAATSRQREQLFGEILAGGRLANAQSERTSKTVREIQTILKPIGSGGFVLRGTKYYCTGALFADRIPVLARLDDPNQVAGLPEGEYVAYVPTATAGLTVEDDWDALGQRLTASGTVRLDDVQVAAEWLVPRDQAFEQPHSYGALAQLLHAAIDVGIARGALDEAAAFVNTKSRPWYEAEVERAVDDPLVVQRFGELAVEVAAAESVLRTAGERLDRALTMPHEQAATDASIAVATAKVLGEKASIATSSALFEVSGTRAAAAELNLGRHWRNARTHTLHDPIRWKYHHIGRHTLSGIAPPRTAVI
ncbi:SfnB family sulfur acquisition oxidoreductase [Nocardioidaceae bacterium SCSIO 66511]|nr:SfnB family sulfur acquisition oxidoreductase [Nocardioidaceae bacterium SCSIO 66511]